MLRSSEVENANAKLSDPETIKALVNDLNKNEPYLYSWMLNHARSVIEEIGKARGKWTPELMNAVHNHICTGYLFMYFLDKEKKDELFEKIKSYDQFESFLEGKADARHYQYDISGLPEDSALLKAKLASMRTSLVDMRKCLLPFIAEDVGAGYADTETLRRLDGLTDGKQK